MSDIQLTQRDYLAAIQAAQSINATHELYDALVGLCGCYIEQGLTQEASDVLAFVLLQNDLAVDTYDTAIEYFEDLESRICPRVILDAKTFAQEVDLEDIIWYVLPTT